MDAHSAASSLGALRRSPRWLVPALVVMVGYYLAARLGLAFTMQPHPISTLWPPNALLLAVLLLAPTRDWWWLVAAVLPAHLFAELQSGVPTTMVLGWYATNCSEALIGAVIVRALVPYPMRLDTLRNTAIVLGGAVLAAPLASSFIDAALVRWIGWGTGEYWDLVATRFLGNGLAEVIIVPLVLTWAAVFSAGVSRMRPVRLGEAAALGAGLLLVCVAVFDLPHRGAHTPPAVFYAPLPFLLWAGVRFGPLGIATALPVMTLAAIWGAVHGLGPFTSGTPQENVHEMQLFLTAASVPLILFAVALEERVRLERESRAQLTHLSRVATLGELSGGIAHELNQPLTAILSNAQAARHFLGDKAGDREMLAEILEDIITADQRAGHVIERLRAMFKRGETQFETLDLNVLVREVAALTHGDLTTRGVEMKLLLAKKLPPISGDRIQLEQVLLNLVMNAAEAMLASPQKDRVIRVHTRATAKQVHANVVDRGPGFTVPPGKLFEAFYTTKPKGLGLGLSISNSIITAHAGRLWASTLRAGGASFLISLPTQTER
jgi:signal transduction histidine kinase